MEFGYGLFPALAGFMVVGPLIAGRLHEKCRRPEAREPAGRAPMLFVPLRSGRAVAFMVVMLLGLFLLWMRPAVLIYALFFGMVALPGTEEIVPMLLLTPPAGGPLLVGSPVGALFAAFAFAFPTLMAARIDALSALRISMAMAWNNLGVMFAWGASWSDFLCFAP